MKKLIALCMAALMLLVVAAGCNNASENTAIYVVSREDGSGSGGKCLTMARAFPRSRAPSF